MAEQGAFSNQPKSIQRRLFFALWPTFEEAAEVDELRDSLSISGRKVPREHLHITLAFLGAVSEQRSRCIAAAAARVKAFRFDLVLDSLGYFRRPQIVWLGPSELPQPLNDLRQQLTEVLATCDTRVDGASFRPHVTLARKASPLETLHVEASSRQPVLAPRFCVWQLTEFVLVESRLSEAGAHYQVLQRYALD